jgi:hypothetical protein
MMTPNPDQTPKSTDQIIARIQEMYSQYSPEELSQILEMIKQNSTLSDAVQMRATLSINHAIENKSDKITPN